MILIRIINKEKIVVLKNNPNFRDLAPKILADVLVGMHLCHFQRNEVVFWEGDESPGLHMIRKGRVNLFKINPKRRELV